METRFAGCRMNAFWLIPVGLLLPLYLGCGAKSDGLSAPTAQSRSTKEVVEAEPDDRASLPIEEPDGSTDIRPELPEMGPDETVRFSPPIAPVEESGSEPIVMRPTPSPIRPDFDEPAIRFNPLRTVAPSESPNGMRVPRIQPHSAPAPLMTVEAEPVEMEPRAMAMEPGPAETRSEEIAENEPVEETSDAASDSADYEVVTVFYGTDRKATASGTATPSDDPWSNLVGAWVVTIGLLALMMVRYSRSRAVLVVAGTGLTAIVVLGAVASVAKYQSNTVGPRPDLGYSNERGQLALGTCQVSIPKDHQLGEVERPSVFRFEFEETPERHVVLLGVNEQSADTFYAKLTDRVNASKKKEAFVFIHGFNVTFDAAARRTAQLAHDLKYDGAPIFYSWPSQGGLLKYAVDETNADWTVPDLQEFLTGVAERSGARSVHLIAHSMGNRALTSALKSLSIERSSEQPMFREIVLTAPDIDADVFRRDIVPAILPTADRITLYASSNDEALAMSKRFHGYPRAGDSGPDLVVIPGIETVDVSSIDTSFLGHSYYGSNDTVIADMLDLLDGSKPADQRQWLHAMRLGELVYWVFRDNVTRLGDAIHSDDSTHR